MYYVIIFMDCKVSTLGQWEIVLRYRLDWTKHCCGTAGVPMEFGQYMEANSDPDVTNNMVHRTFPAMYLGPTGNIQGTKKCLT